MPPQSWTVWIQRFMPRRRWVNTLTQLGSFVTVREFWSFFLSLAPASELPSGSDYFFFRSEVVPMWEDESNKYGGRWTVRFDRKKTSPETMDSTWLELLVAVLGESFVESGHILGASYSSRADEGRFSIWLSVGKSRDTIQIGLEMRALLRIPRSIFLVFVLHLEAKEYAESGRKGQKPITFYL